MTTAIIVFSDGQAQLIGEHTTLRPIIQVLRELIPNLEAQEIDLQRQKVLQSYSAEDLAALLEQKRKQDDTTTGNTPSS